MNFEKKILCIGAGYVGGPTMAVIAAKCPRYQVTVVDLDAKRIEAWKSERLPIYEPGLHEIVKQSLGKNLFFSTEVDQEIQRADIIFVSVNTPTKTYGEGAGKAADLQYWEKTARQILKNSSHDKIIIEKSTLPVRTAEAMDRILNSNPQKIHFEVLANPEFLAEGNAIQDLLFPDRVLVGSQETKAGIAARQELVNLYAHWVDRSRILETNVWSAELSKLTANAFLAQRVSSINSISALCEKTGADVAEVSHAIGTDSRIGSKFLKASVGFGGSCFTKDLLNLVYICEHYGLKEVADYWQSVVQINEWQKKRFVLNIIQALFNTLVDKKIAVLGFAFKANTSDIRESPAIQVVTQLLNEKARVVIHDPKAMENARIALGTHSTLRFEDDPYKAAEGAHAVVILTDWLEYQTLDYLKILNQMENPAFLFDGRNCLDHPKLFRMGYNLYPIGKPPLVHHQNGNISE
ncbi:MAG: nucleotide sugar dehydrogenase [Planctomycetota bacterium]